MKYKRLKTDSYKLIPVLPLDPPKTKEESDYKKFIHWISHLNKPYLDRGRGQKVIIDGVSYYRDVPNISYKLIKRNGKIHQYLTIPKGDEQKEGLEKALATDIKSFRLEPTKIIFIRDHLHAFAIKGTPHHALNLDKDFNKTLKSVFDLVDKDQQLLVNLTLKEVEDHEEKRKELKDRLAGMDPDDIKSIIWHRTKQATISIGKWLYEGLEEETRKKHQQIIQNLKKKGWFQQSKYPMTQRKLAEKNRYMEVEILFLFWSADQRAADKFHRELQKAMNDIQGENQLEVVPVKPNLERISKGYLQYDLPHLILYQKELAQLLYLPSINEINDDFYHELEQKTEPPKFDYEVGGVALGKRMDTQEIISMPRAVTEIDLDDRGIPTLISGKKGSGKTQFLINQVADTFCFGAKNIEEWREKARSAVVFDVADGDMLREIYELVPEYLEDRVIILNHADLDNPLPITNHDILRISQIDGFEEEIAAMETQILMDSLQDKGSTIAVERHFKTALQASYLAGKGNIIDAMRILEDVAYRNEIINRISQDNINVFLPLELRKMDMIFDDPKQLETIDNRVSRLKSTQPWIDGLAQEPTDGLDFWKWINGDDDGAYLVLIYIPKRINKSFRSFLFAHYLMKLWYMTEAREIISKKDRREFLVIVDELHQIFGHRVVPTILEAIYKESRKYRGRYIFTLHGWSSIKSKEIKDTIRDASGNYIMLKGGGDMFASLEKEFHPYTITDFNNLMKLSYTGLFKVDIKKRTHVFQAQLMEPASVRFKRHRSINLEAFRGIKNKYGRPKKEVRAAMINKEEIPCYQPASLEDELAEIIGENESRKAN